MSTEASTRRRVKIYFLIEGKWIDKGTGHISALNSDLSDASLLVLSEKDGSPLLKCKIQPKIEYHKQQDTLIVWTEEDFDLALSFQEKHGCDDIWDIICRVQRRECFLPPCKLGKLDEISEMISQAVNMPEKRENLCRYIDRQNYISKLIDLFHKAEDTEDSDSLHHLFEIARQLILLNRTDIYKIMFNEKNLMDIIGMLEYTTAGRIQHREFLRYTQFKDIFGSNNVEFINKIHQTYRVQYIQDCCLPPPCLFDEHSLVNLKSFIVTNKANILNILHDDQDFFSRLFSRLRKADTSVSCKRDLTLFVREYCNIAIQTEQKETSLGFMYSNGALKAIEFLLRDEDRETKVAALEILQAFVDFQTSLIREYTYQDNPLQSNDEILINIMIQEMLNDKDPEMGDASIIGNMLRIILDPENMNSISSRNEKTEFLNFFYKNCIHLLTKPLLEITQKETLAKDDYRTALIMCHILDILIFCFESHLPLMRTYCFNKDLLQHVLVLLESKHNFLVLYAIRLFRRVIGLKDEFYQRYIMKNYLFRLIIDSFKRNQHRYNLTDSAIIEIFQFICFENIDMLIKHIVENYWDELKDIDYVQTFFDFKTSYDCLTNGKQNTTMSPLSSHQQGKPQLNVMHLVSSGSLGELPDHSSSSSSSSSSGSGLNDSTGINEMSSSTMQRGTFRDPNLNRLSDLDEERWLDDDSDDSNPRNIDEDDLDDASFTDIRPGRHSASHVPLTSLANLQSNSNFEEDDNDDLEGTEQDKTKSLNYINRRKFCKSSLLCHPRNSTISINIKSNNLTNSTEAGGNGGGGNNSNSSSNSDDDEEEDEDSESASSGSGTTSFSGFKRSRNLSQTSSSEEGDTLSTGENETKRTRKTSEGCDDDNDDDEVEEEDDVEEEEAKHPTVGDSPPVSSKKVEEESEKSNQEIGPSFELMTKCQEDGQDLSTTTTNSIIEYSTEEGGENEDDEEEEEQEENLELPVEEMPVPPPPNPEEESKAEGTQESPPPENSIPVVEAKE